MPEPNRSQTAPPLECPKCQSVRVVVLSSKVLMLEEMATRRVLQRTQYVRCLSCGERWRRRMLISATQI